MQKFIPTLLVGNKVFVWELGVLLVQKILDK